MKNGSKFNKLTIVLLVLILILTSCNIQQLGNNVRYSINSSSSNLDPQTSSSKDEFFIIENTMEGLMATDKFGNISLGLAQSYTVSADGLVYTFTLKNDLYWVDYKNKKQQKITSNDFLFAFLRIFSMEDSLNKHSEFFLIKNSKEFLKKELGVASLGIKTPSLKTIEFTLDKPNSNFLKLLSYPQSFACNKEYFNETQGQYGLTYKHLLYSGPFLISAWGKDEYFVLRKNKEYHNEEIVLTDRVTITIIDQEKTSLIEEFLKDKNDIVSVSGEEITLFEEENIDYEEYIDSSFLLIFNTKNEILANQKIRDSLKYSIKFDYYNTTKPHWIKKSRGIIPLDTKINNNQLYTDYIKSDFSDLYNKELSISSYKEGVGQLEMKNPIVLKIAYLENDYLTRVMQEIQKSFQENLSLFIDIIPTNQENLSKMYNDSDFDIILYNKQGNQSSPYQILSDLSRFINEDLEYLSTLQNGLNTEDDQEAARMFYSAEQMIIENSVVYPVLQQSSFHVNSKSIENVTYSLYSGSVLFKYVFKN